MIASALSSQDPCESAANLMRVTILTAGSRGDVQPYVALGAALRAEDGVGLAAAALAAAVEARPAASMAAG